MGPIGSIFTPLLLQGWQEGDGEEIEEYKDVVLLSRYSYYAIVMARWWQILYGTICHHWFRASAVAVQGSKRDDGTGEGSSKSLYTWSIVMTLVCFHYISSSTRLRRTAPPLRLYILPWREIPTRISSIKFTICNFILLFPPSSAIPST